MDPQADMLRKDIRFKHYPIPRHQVGPPPQRQLLRYSQVRVKRELKAEFRPMSKTVAETAVAITKLGILSEAFPEALRTNRPRTHRVRGGFVDVEPSGLSLIALKLKQQR